MNYYEHHIGDYDADTAHLTWAEDMAYTRLLRLYYRREKAIPSDIADACRLVRAVSRDQKQAVESVLKEFFTLTEDGWRQTRCDEEIGKYQTRVAHNQRVGKLGGRPKKSEPAENPPGLSRVSKKNPPQTPDTIHQSPSSVANATAGDAGIAADQVAALTRDELWSAGKSLLEGAGMPPRQCGSFVGKLVKDYGDLIVVDAVRAAVVARPADPAEYLKAICMRARGQRPTINRQEELEESNRVIAANWAAEGDSHAGM